MSGCVFDSKGSRLLVVQPEPVLAELSSFRLELLGYQIALVASGAEAMGEIHASLPDLVVVDTSLPDVDGLEWLSQMRAEYTAEQLPVLVFSLDPSLETVERAFHAGAQDYLITPFDPVVLEEKIEALLATRVMSSRRR
jgi:DNA-binding response OmpR family regulator